MKLGLGTAQFGLDYGITNARGRVPLAEVEEILARARAAGVDTVDTAMLYGNAEEVLGKAAAGENFRIVTKTPKLDMPGMGSFADRVEATLETSLRRLRVSKIHGLLFHRASDLLDPEGRAAWKRANAMKERGLVERIGFSLSDHAIGRKVVETHAVDIVQMPINILDQRALKSGLADDLKERGIEIHARSPFLQGALAVAPENLPDFLKGARGHLSKLTDALAAEGLTLMEGALRFVLGLNAVDRVIVGVTSAAEFAQLVAIASDERGAKFDFSIWNLEDLSLIDPPRWPNRS